MTCYLNTQILLNPSECEGIFTFTPDLITDPSSGVTELTVSILKNCKDDLKVTLLDENGCSLESLVLRCSQYRIVDISENFVIDQNSSNESVLELYDTNYSQMIQINANNLNLVGEYVTFEETAYFYRRVQQTYLNLWCGGERNGIVCYILNNALQASNELDLVSSPSILSQFVYSMGNDLVKARVVALKQLCDCGKVCNDQFFAPPTNPCQALRGCCPRY
jgi:hypothetical protein